MTMPSLVLGQVTDALLKIEETRLKYPKRRIVLVGFSLGAKVGHVCV